VEELFYQGKYTFKTFIPGGNDTALVIGIIGDIKRRELIDIDIRNTAQFQNIEQVGFISSNPATPELIMAGGEFCGNATRSAAWHYLKGQQGEISIKVSGVKLPLKAGIDADKTVWAQMPVADSLDCVSELKQGYHLVQIEGISHIVVSPEASKQYLGNDGTIDKQKMKGLAKEIMVEYDLLKCAAAGVIFLENTREGLAMYPCVYVSNNKSFYYETACGSGTIAAGLVACKSKHSSVSVDLLQPSGKKITAKIEYSNSKITNARITGEVICDELEYPRIFKSAGNINKDIHYKELRHNEDRVSIFQVQTAKEINGILPIIRLFYRECFSKEECFSGEKNYGELFNDCEIDGIFRRYAEKGILLLAIDMQSATFVGFIAAEPLVIELEPDVFQKARDFGFDWSEYWYCADLGVSDIYKNRGNATRLLNRLLALIPKNKILVRTNEKNDASIATLKKSGFTVIDGMKQEKSALRLNGEYAFDTRIFFTLTKG